jgi:hypothetical protein
VNRDRLAFVACVFRGEPCWFYGEHEYITLTRNVEHVSDFGWPPIVTGVRDTIECKLVIYAWGLGPVPSEPPDITTPVALPSAIRALLTP